MVNQQSDDQRQHRTRQLILESALSLIAERGWDKTTVKEITHRADIGRSTFYSHYETKEDLVLSGLASMIKLLEVDGRPLSHAWLVHLEDNQSAIRNVLRADGRFTIIELIRQALTDRFAEQLNLQSERSGSIPTEVEAKFLAGGLVSLVVWWVENDFPVTADELHDQYAVLSGGR